MSHVGTCGPGYRLMIMPNEPTRRDRAQREPHVRPLYDPQPARTAAGSLRTRAGVGIAAVAVIAVLVAFTGFFSLPNRSPDSVAAAGATLAASPSAPSPSATGPLESGAVPSGPAPTEAATTPPTDAPATAVPSATPDSAPGTLIAASEAKRLQKAIDAFRKKTGIPGISVAIVWDDGRAWAGATGKANVADDTPMTTGTGFAFASVSKTLTAAVVLQLVDEGKVALDRPAAAYLPSWRLDKQITVRMLMDHRSSLPDFFANAKIDRALQRDKEATWTAERTWKYVPPYRPVPGTVYDYSNTNYLLLGELVERVTGNTLAHEVRTRLLDPLQLNTAWYQVAEKPRTPLSTGYRLTRNGSSVFVKPVAGKADVMPFRSVVSAAGGAGSIAGTAMDAARWMQAYGSGQLVSKATFHEQLRDAKYTRAMRAIVTYGLGVQLITIEGQKTLGHSGRYLGYQNTVRYLRGPGISIAILTNQNTWDPAILMHRLVKIVAPVAPVPSASPTARP